MDTLPDDLSKLESRLAARVPATNGLDVDAMLFAAGRASARPGPARLIWPALTGILAVAVCVLAIGLANERKARMALAGQLQRVPSYSAPAIAPTELPSENTARSSSGLLAVHQALEQGLDPWPAQTAVGVDTSIVLPPSPVFQAHSLAPMLDP